LARVFRDQRDDAEESDDKHRGNTASIAATPMIAWSAPSPSSPAPLARRCAALGLDCSVRPSKVADRAANALFPMLVPVAYMLDGKCESTFTEPSYTKLLTFPVIPFFESHGVKLLRALTDRGTEYCGNPERHEYELYLAIEDIDHSRTKAKSPQTNGICERFHKTVLNEFYRVAFRKKIYRSIAELQEDLDAWIREYNEARSHQGRWCFGKTPMQTFLDALPMTKEKMIAA
jgi:hypothetical protein